MATLFPARLQGVLWSKSLNNLDLQKDKLYIIHQIFSYGRMEDILWLFHTYSKAELQDTFVHHPYKDYDAARFHFVKNFLLNLKETRLSKESYVKNTPRNFR